ncbi:helix-turn-helix transcriptional regulator [uncultured Adlercreutzia sp.]|uniref:helix-turn-helix domain-containing protein n=1 Tax=uncultured Adlercreutzia sp. TaxID=875803 RepID=UPI002676028C|nr:helix-turn-helix transcriptional regulator [uncultured Adlercreutzia sp.]
MVYALFFYDMATTMVNFALCALFAYWALRFREPVQKWLAALFLLCTLDIMLLYLLDFVPDFKFVFGSLSDAVPYFYMYLHLGILLCYRLVAGCVFSCPPGRWEAVLWIAVAAFAAVAMTVFSGSVRALSESACMGLLQLYIVFIAVRGLRSDARTVLGRRSLTVLVALFAACSTGYLVAAGVSFWEGSTDPRNWFVDASGLVTIVYSLLYAVSFLRHREGEGGDRMLALIASAYGLTRREEEVLGMLIAGKSNQEIASDLFISVGTVKTHAHNIYAKLGLSGRSDLAAFVRAERVQAGAALTLDGIGLGRR